METSIPPEVTAETAVAPEPEASPSERRAAPARPAWWRRIGAAAVLAFAFVFFGHTVSGHRPIGDWLFWTYLQAWSLSLFWSLACLSTGFLLVQRLLGNRLPYLERIAFAFPTGVFAFFVAMFVLGLLGWYGPALFAILPIAMLAAGALPLWRTTRRWWGHVSFLRARQPPTSPWVYAGWALALLVLAMLYFVVLTPSNIAFDSRWKHLAIAEHYAAQGFVGPFLEGWYPGTAPHLPSFLFAWIFLVDLGLFGQLTAVSHLEFVTFLWALVGIPALVRRLVPGADPRLVWVARFLFPGVLLYDSNLSTGTDHIAAIFAIPIFLMTLRAWRRLDVRSILVLAVMLSGAILTKYSSAFALFAFPIVAVAIRTVVLGVKSARGTLPAGTGRWNFLVGPLVCLVAGLVLTAPHWLKNWVFYGSPLYPSLSDRFTMHPWSPDAAQIFRYGYLGQIWRPETNWDGLLDSLKVLLTFSIDPHDWGEFHGKVPVFGSLFTVALLCMPFVRSSKRLWVLFGCVHLGIFTWFWVHHQDRHLQTLMPLMAAATAAVFVVLWRMGRLVRLGLVAMIAAQIVWGLDVYFWPTHNMARTPVKNAVDLVASGWSKEPKQRLKTFQLQAEVRRSLPKDAKLLLHDIHVHTGIGVPSVSDHQGWQAGISYGHLHSPGAIWDKLKEMGITHVLYPSSRSRAWDSLAGDVAIFDFFDRHLEDRQKMHGHTLARLPAERPEGDGPQLVFVQSCGKRWKSGQYRFEDLRVPAFGPRLASWPKPLVAADEAAERRALIASSDFLLVQKGCDEPTPQDRPGFRQVATRKRYERIPQAYEAQGETWSIWRRTRPAPAAAKLGGARGGSLAPARRAFGPGAIELPVPGRPAPALRLEKPAPGAAK